MPMKQYIQYELNLLSRTPTSHTLPILFSQQLTSYFQMVEFSGVWFGQNASWGNPWHQCLKVSSLQLVRFPQRRTHHPSNGGNTRATQEGSGWGLSSQYLSFIETFCVQFPTATFSVCGIFGTAIVLSFLEKKRLSSVGWGRGSCLAA